MSKSQIKFTVIRLFIAALSAGLYLGAGIIGDTRIVQSVIEIHASAKLIILCSLGYQTGFLAARFNPALAKLAPNPSIQFAYYAALCVGLAAYSSTIGNTTQLIAAIAMLSGTLVLATEPSARFQNNLYQAFIPDIGLSTAVFIACLPALQPASTTIHAFVLTTAIVFIGYAIYSRSYSHLSAIKLVDFRTHFKVIQFGFPVYIGTTLFGFYLLLDRLVPSASVNPSDYATKAFAITIAIGSCLPLSTLNFFESIQVGKLLSTSRTGRPQTLIENLKRKTVTATIVFFACIIFSFIFSALFSYLKHGSIETQLVQITLIYTVGVGAALTAGSITHLTSYKGKAKPITLSMAVATTTYGIALFVSPDTEILTGVMPVIFSTALVGHGLFCIAFTFSVARNMPQKPI